MRINSSIAPLAFVCSFLPLFVLAASANAAPVQLERQGDIRVFFIPESMKQVTTTVRSGQSILTYDKTRFELDANFNDDPSRPYQSVVRTTYADCASGTTAAGGMEDHAGEVGGGAIVRQTPDTGLPPPDFFQPLALSDYDKITRPVFNAICGQ